jgi:hypothetical protein
MKTSCIAAVVIVVLAGVVLITICVWAALRGIANIRPDAEAVAKQYFAAIQAKDIERALDLYDARFYAQTPRDEWRQMLQNLGTKLGDLKSYQQVGWNVQTMTGTAGHGHYCELRFHVTYSKYASDETLVLFRAKRTDPVKIVGHNINSPGLLKG